MSKLSFRARALDASKPMPIYMAEELPDLPDYSAINRAVPQMPSGMEKEEECEHHLQRAICAGLIIPTPEVADLPERDFYDKVYPANYKQPRQLIHMQPFTMEQDIPDYDMDSEDERWLHSQTQKMELSPLKFEEMMDRLEKSSGQTVVTLNDAKALLKEDDDLIIAVFDYWLNKRLNTQHPLILTVKTEQRAGTAANNPYLAFRRRTEKMQTRKNRKNDETSYEKMLKLRRDLHRAVTLLELVKKREKMKREHVHLTVEIYEKRYHARDFSGAIYAEVAAVKATRPAFTPIFHNHYTNQSWTNKAAHHKDHEIVGRKEKRQYKKRKHKSRGAGGGLDGLGLSSDEEALPQPSPEPEEVEDEGMFAFRRNKLCSYHMPLDDEGNWPWCAKEENGLADKRFRFTLTSLSNPSRCIGFARRRVGRGGRIILDRVATDHDDFWRTLDFSIVEPKLEHPEQVDLVKTAHHPPAITCFNNHHRTDVVVKSELISSSDVGTLRTNVALSENGAPVEVKKERADNVDSNDDMVEVLRSVRADWLHFRPKTPPPEHEPPCGLLPASESYFVPGVPFSVELQPLEAPTEFLDTSPFLSDPFTFELGGFAPEEVVPVTDTRQPASDSRIVHTTASINLNVNVGLNTLTPPPPPPTPIPHTPSVLFNEDGVADRTIGCSQFQLSDAGGRAHQITSTSFAAKVTDGRRARGREGAAAAATTNGLRSQFGLDGRTKNNRLPYAFSSGVGYPNASSGTLSLHTSAHTLTLNSHSANILEIPITAEDSSKLVSSQCNDSGTATSNNKSKPIVRKNNLVMEVT